MNDDYAIDPALRSLEARLSALRPKLGDREAQELFYQCAFAAGQNSAARRTRRWQLGSAALAVLLLAMSFGRMSEPELVTRREPATADSAATVLVTASESINRPRSHAVVGPLDAWQVRADAAGLLETALARFKQRETGARTLAVGTMTHDAVAVP